MHTTLHNMHYTLLVLLFAVFAAIVFAFGTVQDALALHAQEDPFVVEWQNVCRIDYCYFRAGDGAEVCGWSCSSGSSGEWCSNTGGSPPCTGVCGSGVNCFYIDRVNAWSACANGVQVATDVRWTHRPGRSCQHVPLTRPCPDCGSANGVRSATAPTAGLCAHGTPSPVTRTSTWNWSCSVTGSDPPAVSCSAPVGCPAGQVVINGSECCPSEQVVTYGGVQQCGCPAGLIITGPPGAQTCGCPPGQTVVSGACCPNGQVVSHGGITQCGCPAGTIIDNSTNPKTCCADPDGDGQCGCADSRLDCAGVCIDPVDIQDTVPLTESGPSSATVTIPANVCCDVEGTRHCGGGSGTTTTVTVDSHPDNISLSCECEVCSGSDCGPIIVTEPVQCVCTAFRCSSANTCVGSPVIASSLSSPACTRECTTNADCSGGGIQEVTP